MLLMSIVAGGCVISPLGMEHGHIKDGDITASSYFDFKSVGPQNGRYVTRTIYNIMTQ